MVGIISGSAIQDFIDMVIIVSVLKQIKCYVPVLNSINHYVQEFKSINK